MSVCLCRYIASKELKSVCMHVRVCICLYVCVDTLYPTNPSIRNDQDLALVEAACMGLARLLRIAGTTAPYAALFWAALGLIQVQPLYTGTVQPLGG